MFRQMRALALGLAGAVILGSVGDVFVLCARAKEPEWKVIEADVPAWADAITEALGEETIAGLAMTHGESMDEGVMELVEKHANAVTFGNELKPDCMFGYSNDKVPGTEEIVFNGQPMVVPIPTFTRADQMLRKLKRWNDEHPDRFVRVRGHVLLWHSQTPEWFFHEDYDKNKDYVDKDTMNLRLEWYIKTVLEHFLGEESEYKDMFYGWDVVNEAASDGNTVYRTDTENGSDKLSDSTHGSKSSWWHVYESNEFIINAFKYANKYAPANLELYYNDYNETVAGKREHIKELLTAVKAAEGPAGEGTRIDAFGMQGHYSMNGFSLSDFEISAREYAAIVGKVQLTELDMKASSSYDGSPSAKETEYIAQANVYQDLFECIQKMKADGVNFSGITFWGNIDGYSWLQSQSNVGGGANGTQSQCPLLFDDDYKVKPAFWVFVDPSQIVPPTKKVQAYYCKEIDFKKKQEFETSQGKITITLIPLWNEEGLQLEVDVADVKVEEADAVTVFVDSDNARKDGITPIAMTQNRADCKGIAGGYKAIYTIPIEEIAIGKTIGIDVRVNNNGELVSFNDFSNKQDTDSSRYALLTFSPEVYKMAKGSVIVDGNLEDKWEFAADVPMMTNSGANARGVVKTLWDNDNLYIYAKIKDSTVNENDGVLVCIDEANGKETIYDQNDRAFFINTEGVTTVYGKKAKEQDVASVVTKTEEGYVLEASVAWKNLVPKVHALIGFNIAVVDADESGKALGALAWAESSEKCTEDASLLGVVKFAAENKEKPEAAEELAEGVINAVAIESTPEESTDQNDANEDAKKKKTLIFIGVFVALAIPAFMIFVVTTAKSKQEEKEQENTKKNAPKKTGPKIKSNKKIKKK